MTSPSTLTSADVLTPPTEAFVLPVSPGSKHRLLSSHSPSFEGPRHPVLRLLPVPTPHSPFISDEDRIIDRASLLTIRLVELAYTAGSPDTESINWVHFLTVTES